MAILWDNPNLRLQMREMLLTSPLQKLIAYILSTNSKLFVGLMILSSCSTYLFERPQPVDAANVYEFPKIMRGRFVLENRDTLTVGKNYFRMASMEVEKVINGAYANGADTTRQYKSLQRIEFDSL